MRLKANYQEVFKYSGAQWVDGFSHQQWVSVKGAGESESKPMQVGPLCGFLMVSLLLKLSML